MIPPYSLPKPGGPNAEPGKQPPKSSEVDKEKPTTPVKSRNGAFGETDVYKIRLHVPDDEQQSHNKDKVSYITLYATADGLVYEINGRYYRILASNSVGVTQNKDPSPSSNAKDPNGNPLKDNPTDSPGSGRGSTEFEPSTVQKTGQLSMKARFDLARAAGFNPSDAKIMAAISQAESRGFPLSVNNVGRDESYGLWQINMLGSLGVERDPLFRSRIPGYTSRESLKDPWINAQAAKIIFNQQGLKAWSTYSDGKYNQHMPEANKAAGTTDDTGGFGTGPDENTPSTFSCVPSQTSEQRNSAAQTQTAQFTSETSGTVPAEATGLRYKSKEAFAGGNASPGLYALGHMIQNNVKDFYRFTAFNDRYHKGYPNSKHNRGLALDFTVNNPSNSRSAEAYVINLFSRNGIGGTVINEYIRPSKHATGGHIHVQFNTYEDSLKAFNIFSKGEKPTIVSASIKLESNLVIEEGNGAYIEENTESFNIFNIDEGFNVISTHENIKDSEVLTYINNYIQNEYTPSVIGLSENNTINEPINYISLANENVPLPPVRPSENVPILSTKPEDLTNKTITTQKDASKVPPIPPIPKEVADLLSDFEKGGLLENVQKLTKLTGELNQITTQIAQLLPGAPFSFIGIASQLVKNLGNVQNGLNSILGELDPSVKTILESFRTLPDMTANIDQVQRILGKLTNSEFISLLSPSLSIDGVMASIFSLNPSLTSNVQNISDLLRLLSTVTDSATGNVTIPGTLNQGNIDAKMLNTVSTISPDNINILIPINLTSPTNNYVSTNVDNRSRSIISISLQRELSDQEYTDLITSIINLKIDNQEEIAWFAGTIINRARTMGKSISEILKDFVNQLDYLDIRSEDFDNINSSIEFFLNSVSKNNYYFISVTKENESQIPTIDGKLGINIGNSYVFPGAKWP